MPRYGTADQNWSAVLPSYQTITAFSFRSHNSRKQKNPDRWIRVLRIRDHAQGLTAVPFGSRTSRVCLFCSCWSFVTPWLEESSSTARSLSTVGSSLPRVLRSRSRRFLSVLVTGCPLCPSAFPRRLYGAWPVVALRMDAAPGCSLSLGCSELKLGRSVR